MRGHRAVALRIITALIATCSPASETRGQSSPSALTAEQCLPAAEGKKVTFCHRTGQADPGVTITTAAQACANAHATNHPADYLGPCQSQSAGCPLSGTIHSSEGVDFGQVFLAFWGYDFETGAELYLNPAQFITDEPGRYQPLDFPEVVSSFVPLLCGLHTLVLHSVDRDRCHANANEICFSNWTWWSEQSVAEPITEGIEIPVVQLSGSVLTQSDGVSLPVPAAKVLATSGFPPFSFVSNEVSSSSDGSFELVVLPGMQWQLNVSVGDEHPMNLDVVNEEVWVDGPVELDIEMPRGPQRCPFSGIVRTSAGVALESLDFWHFGVYYGLTGWHFGSIAPGTYFRYPHEEVLLSQIPLICSHQDAHEPAEWSQDFYLDSVQSTSLPSCIDPERYDQPCLEFWNWQESWALLEPISEDIVIPVVKVSGAVSLEDGTPIPGSNVEARSEICIEQDAAGNCTRSPGSVSNHAVTGLDGSYEIAVIPSALSSYAITFTTPEHGTVTTHEVITSDATVDAPFSP